MNPIIDIEKEIVLDAPRGVGVLSRISSALAEGRVNIRAICGYERKDRAHIRLVTDDNQRAVEILRRAGYEPSEHEVVRCEISPHVVHVNAAELLRDFEVENNYWCAASHGGENAVLYFSLRKGASAMPTA